MLKEDWINVLFMGLPLILAGLLVVRFPMLISGLNTMSKARRDKVDVKGLARMMRRYLIFMGVGSVVFPILLRKMNVTSGSILISIVFILGMSVVASVKAKRYTKEADAMKEPFLSKSLPKGERNARKFLVIFGVLLGTAFLIQFVRVMIPPKVEVSDREIVITGAYGRTVSREEIGEVRLQDHLQGGIRVNGVAAGNFCQGHFRSKELGSCLLYLRNAGTPPYIILALKDQKPVVINLKTPEQTRELYRKIMEMSDK